MAKFCPISSSILFFAQKTHKMWCDLLICAPEEYFIWLWCQTMPMDILVPFCSYYFEEYPPQKWLTRGEYCNCNHFFFAIQTAHLVLTVLQSFLQQSPLILKVECWNPLETRQPWCSKLENSMIFFCSLKTHNCFLPFSFKKASDDDALLSNMAMTSDICIHVMSPEKSQTYPLPLYLCPKLKST